MDAVYASNLWPMRETALASARVVDLAAVSTRAVRITGTAAIAGFGVGQSCEYLLTFAASLTLMHAAGRLILPGGVNIITALGDTALVSSDAAGIWTVRHYQRASGLPLGVRRSQILRAVSTTLPGGLAAFLDAGLVSASPDDPSNIAYFHEPFALPGGVLAGLLMTYCQANLGMTASAAAARVAEMFALAATLTPVT